MSTNERHLLLASQSPRRRELLALLGLPFDATVPDVVEIPQPDELPTALVARLSQAKARVTGERNQVFQKKPGLKPPIIVACDTIVTLDGELMGKPRDATEATAMLRRLREQHQHIVYSAITLLEPTTGRSLTDMAETRVTMRPYTDDEIAAYVASSDPLDKAGAYAIQHPEFCPVAKLQGCYTNVMGLPLCHLTRCLNAWGIKPPRDIPAACQLSTGHTCTVYVDILNDK